MVSAVARDYSRWGVPHVYARESFFAATSLPDGLIVIDYGEIELPMLVRRRGAPVTFYGFHAAMNPTIRRPLPFFQGRNIAPAATNSVLLCDPSLYLHEAVKVGWFLGNRLCPLVTELPLVLDHLDRLMGAERRLLWGNSAGGTAALRYSREQDVAIAVNPQTILEHFTWGRVLPWIEHGWQASGADARSLAGRIGDLRLHAPRGRTVYVQNIDDEHHGRHFLPYAHQHGFRTEPGDDGRQGLILGTWGKGHTPPPPEMQRRLVAGEADRMLEEMGVRPGLWNRLRRVAAR